MHKLLGLSLVVAAAAMPQPKPSAVVAFTNVSVLPMDRETVLSGQTVVIRDGKIAELGAAAAVPVPDGAVSVDGQGKFLMPTLAEMHAHIPAGNAPDSTVERTLFLYAANGLGTIRGMLGDPRHLQYRERVAKGELFSPRIYTSGPSFNGKSATAFDALDAKADELEIPFAGHVPLEVGLQRALEAKYHSIDHLDGYVEALAKEPLTSQFFGLNLINQVDESRIPSLVAATKAAAVWQVPTQVLMDSLLSEQSADEMAKWPEMKYVPAEMLKAWIDQKNGISTKAPAADRQKFLLLRRKIMKALFDGGVPFALGSDAPQWWNVPGFSAHRELKSLVAAGFTPFQALQTGTVNPARYFGTSASTGTVARGMRADLLLLDANPLTDVGNTTKIAGVMLNGRWMSRPEIDKRLKDLETTTTP